MKEALLYKKLDNNKVKCNVCQVGCIVSDGKRGACRTRLNKDGIFYTLIYSKVSSIHADPIEKKPLYHFYPGTYCLSLGTLGCSFHCPGCQNWQISQSDVDLDQEIMTDVTPEESVRLIEESGCKGISWTYNEPSIWFEYTLDGARLAKEKGLYTVYVTNGYMTIEALDTIGPYLDAFRVDIKGFSRESYKKITGLSKFEGILDVTARAKNKWGMHVEVITNVTPTINDSDQMLQSIASWIAGSLGPDVPWHVTRFHPYLDLSHIPPTPIETLERAREIGTKEGLNFVYIGNVSGHPGEDTYCPGCKMMIIKRDGFCISEYHIKDGACKFCRKVISGRF